MRFIAKKVCTTLLTFMGPCIVSVFLLIHFQQAVTLHSLFISRKLLYMFRVVFPPIIRSTHSCIYSISYLSNRYCYLPLLWNIWNWFECSVGVVLICFGVVQPHQNKSIQLPHHTQTSSIYSTIAAGSRNGLTSTRYCKYSCVCS
jgi:hypothetical protein